MSSDLLKLPLLPSLVAAVVYFAAIGSHYYYGMESKHYYKFLVCGMLLGVLMGFMVGLDIVGIVFRVLPGLILIAVRAHSFCLRVGLL